MAIMRGNGGTFAGVGIGIGKIKTWSASLDPGIVDVSGFGDLGYGTSDSTIGRISGSASGFVSTTTSPIGTEAWAAAFSNSTWSLNITLTMATTKTYVFTAIVSFNVTAVYSDHIDLIVNYTSTGQPTVTWT